MNGNKENFERVASDQSPALVLTTVAQAEDARKIAATLIAERLAACVSQIPMTSTYVWQGEVQTESELQLFIKTSKDLVVELMKRLGAIHPYETPEILEIDVPSASASYANWVVQSTRPNTTADFTTQERQTHHP